VAIVKATCDTCGDVELGVGAVQIQLCLTDATSTYSFLCPVCHLIVNKEANSSAVESLTRAGAGLVAWTMPAELDEPKVGPPIGHDDLLAFHIALEGEGLEAGLAALTANG
jgi:hypothetical protein